MKKILITVTSLVLLMVLTILVSTYASASSAKFTLKAVSALPREDPDMANFYAWIDKVRELSKGELVIDYRGGPGPISPFDLALAVRNHVIDVAYIFAGAYEGMVPAVSAWGVSLLTPTEENKLGVTDLMAKLHKKVGLHLLGRIGANDIGPGTIFYMWTIDKKVEKASDLRGLKIAGISGQVDRFIAALGATSAVLPFPEIYPALQYKTVDALWEGFQTPRPDGSYKLLKYMIDHPFMSDNLAVIMNPSSWKRLPKHLQSILVEARDWNAKTYVERMLPLHKKTRQIYKNSGMKFIRFSPSDAEWYRKTAFEAEWAYLESKPEIGSVIATLKKMMYTGRPFPPQPKWSE